MITGLTPFPQNNNSTTPNGSNQALGKNDFLKLLVAQLSAQDPLSPMESQDFSAQLAQFSSLEQITNVNENLKELQNIQTALSNSSMINLIGKQVDVPGNSFELTAGKPVNLNYSLEEDAASLVVDVFDSTGQRVTRLTPNNLSAGNSFVTLTGLDGNGNLLPAGTYTFEVKAVDQAGSDINTETFTTGTVTDVLFEDGVAFAIVNGQKLRAGEITRVS